MCVYAVFRPSSRRNNNNNLIERVRILKERRGKNLAATATTITNNENERKKEISPKTKLNHWCKETPSKYECNEEKEQNGSERIEME